MKPVPHRVLLVDDHELIRQGLRRSLERAGDFDVVGEAGTVEGAVQQVVDLQPDVVIIDVRLPDGSGLAAVKKMRVDSPSLGIVVLTMYPGDDHLFAAMEAGASVFVSKEVPVSDVLSAARHAVASPLSFSAANLAAATRRRFNGSDPRLSPREMEVLSLLAQGHATGVVSRLLFISESTTKSHIARLYEKLGATNRTQALMTALRLGLLSNPDA